MTDDDDVTPLIRSRPLITVASRFLVKESNYNDGNNPESTMMVIRDLVDPNFKIQFFKSREKAADFLKLLNAASN